MSTLLLGIGVLVAVFVGINVGGSNTGVAFGPAVGSRALSKTTAAALMTVFAFLGGWTVGRNVVRTLGTDLVTGDPFTVTIALVTLALVGLSTAVTNYVGIPTSTSLTAVGVVVSFGLATQSLSVPVVLRITAWSVLSPLIAFWLSAVVGRYWYASLVALLPVERSDGPLLAVSRRRAIPLPRRGSGTTGREVAGVVLVVAVACLMAFGAGANNVANVVAPLVGSGVVSPSAGVLIAGVAIGLGAFTVARRTLDTVSNDLTALSLHAALVIAAISASLSIGLSELGIPGSFVLISTMSAVGLGWGRAARSAADCRPVIEPDDDSLYDRDETVRVVCVQFLAPLGTSIVAFLPFRALEHLP